MAIGRAAALVVLVLCALRQEAAAQRYNAIWSFGDSISDTGNLCVNGAPAGLTLTQPPYGETFFGRATCRCSDGRLVVDFLGTASSAFNFDMSTFFQNHRFPPKKTEHLALLLILCQRDVTWRADPLLSAQPRSTGCRC